MEFEEIDWKTLTNQTLETLIPFLLFLFVCFVLTKIQIFFLFCRSIVRNTDSARLTEEMGTNCVCHPERKKERQRERGKGEKDGKRRRGRKICACVRMSN